MNPRAISSVGWQELVYGVERLGRPRPFVDGMIAAVAVTRGLILFTRNTSDFADFGGLHVEDWFEEGRPITVPDTL